MGVKAVEISTPISDEVIGGFSVGDKVLLSGIIHTARDAAHARLVKLLEAGEEMPFPFAGGVVYYAGPSPARPGAAVGAIGPTTSGRMDAYAPVLIARGLKVMIGKGLRSDEVHRAIELHKGLYLAAVGGAAALISRSVKSAEVIAFPDLGTEAIRRLEVERFPAVVAIDSRGRDIYLR
jgi:fumarate hydratase subunit beta